MLDMVIMDRPLWMWGSFLAVVLFLLAFDLGVLQRKGPREISIPQSLKLSLFYICCGLAFGLFVWQELGDQAAKEYYTGFIIEKSLSLDNIFVISLVFSYFAIPRDQQYRVLFWGVLGVILLRGLLIGIGIELIHDFEWILYLLAAFLIYTGISMLRGGDDEEDIGNSRVIRFVRKHMRVTEELHDAKFFVRLKDSTGKKLLYATPLFLALVCVELVDLIFAMDSVPAIFAITDDAYVVYTSNVFAILGLRALYFALAAMLHRFQYLDYSLAAVLVFIGGKVFLPLVGIEKLPASISLGVTVGLLAAGVIYSLYKTKDGAKPNL